MVGTKVSCERSLTVDVIKTLYFQVHTFDAACQIVNTSKCTNCFSMISYIKCSFPYSSSTYDDMSEGVEDIHKHDKD